MTKPHGSNNRISRDWLSHLATEAHIFQFMPRRLFAFVGWCLIAMAAASAKLDAQQTDVWIATKTGEMLRATTDAQSIPWNNVAANGDISESQISINTVKKLTLTQSPASRTIARIRKLLLQLNDNKYSVRQNAEIELLKIGSQYLDIIRAAPKITDSEFRIRYERIKESLGRGNRTNLKTEFDYCDLNDGKRIEGDIGEWKMNLEIRGKTYQWGRDEIATLYCGDPAGLTQTQHLPHKQQKFYYARDEEFLSGNQLLVDFEKNSHGVKIDRDSELNVKTEFTNLGCIFESEGYPTNEVIVCNFAMKESSSKFNSVCNHHPDASSKSKFYGVMRVRFVDPNFPILPATVNEFGLFVAVVSPRQTLIEAYNVDGYRIGTVESTDRECFVGIHSIEPIAFVRVLANYDYVPTASESLDENYAVDDVSISVPVVSDQLAAGEKVNVVFNDGQRLLCDSIDIENDKLVLTNSATLGERVEIARDEVRTIVYPGLLQEKSIAPDAFSPKQNSNAESTEEGSEENESQTGGNRVLGMLGDGSVVELIPGTQFTMANFDNAAIQDGQLVGYWGENQVVRYPESSDFEKGKVVVVLPTVRAVAEQFKLADAQIEIDVESVVPIVPPAKLERVRMPGDLDPMKDMSYSSSPCVWFAEPVSIADSAGSVRLKDGRRFRLNSDFGFTLSAVANGKLTISRNGKSMEVHVSEIRSIRFPAAN
jgi:hypothetical protein